MAYFYKNNRKGNAGERFLQNKIDYCPCVYYELHGRFLYHGYSAARRPGSYRVGGTPFRNQVDAGWLSLYGLQM